MEIKFEIEYVEKDIDILCYKINRGSSKDVEIRGRELFRKLQAHDFSSCKRHRALSFALATTSRDSRQMFTTPEYFISGCN